MIRARIFVVVGIILLKGCTNAEPAVETEEVGVVKQAIGSEDVNDFRSRKTENKAFAKRKSDCASDPRVTLGLVSADICTGADLFFREPFGGNGRACGTCHAVQFDMTVSPQSIATLPSDDPLFVAENNPTLAQLEIPELMHGFGLILENVDGAEAPTTKFVMRSVPHTLSLSQSITPLPITNPDGTAADGTTQPPNQRVGWSGDGAPNPGSLREFQLGAIQQHYTKSLNRVAGTDFVLATDEQLNDIQSFLLTIGRSKEVDLTMVALADPAAETGRTTFIASRCNGCHHNAGALNAAGFNRNFNTGIETVRIPRVDQLNIPHDGGFGGGAPGAPFNHDSNGDGILDSFGNGTFSPPPLIEAADTGPFFHTNAFTVIEDAIRFYTTANFANSANGGGTPIPLTDTDIANVGKFLRTLNASFNDQVVIRRLTALVAITNDQKNHFKGLQQGLVDAAQADLQDAINDLSQVGISPDVLTHLQSANQSLTDANSNSSWDQRLTKVQAALSEVTAGEAGLGTGLDMGIGQGSLMF